VARKKIEIAICCLRQIIVELWKFLLISVNLDVGSLGSTENVQTIFELRTNDSRILSTHSSLTPGLPLLLRTWTLQVIYSASFDNPLPVHIIFYSSVYSSLFIVFSPPPPHFPPPKRSQTLKRVSTVTYVCRYHPRYLHLMPPVHKMHTCEPTVEVTYPPIWLWRSTITEYNFGSYWFSEVQYLLAWVLTGTSTVAAIRTSTLLTSWAACRGRAHDITMMNRSFFYVRQTQPERQ
jgi:hypothetical protein